MAGLFDKVRNICGGEYDDDEYDDEYDEEYESPSKSDRDMDYSPIRQS